MTAKNVFDAATGWSMEECGHEQWSVDTWWMNKLYCTWQMLTINGSNAPGKDLEVHQKKMVHVRFE